MTKYEDNVIISISKNKNFCREQFSKFNGIDITKREEMLHITLDDVAKISGFSKSTVSRALRNDANVNPHTKKKIKEAVQRLGYTPNIVARSLRSRKTTTIGVIIADICNPFFPSVVRGIEDTARRKGYNIILCNTDEKYEREREALETLLQKRVDGLLIAPVQKKFDDLLELRRREIPFVLIGRHFEPLETDHVISDDVKGAFMAAEYLIKKGHKKILFINGPSHISSARERVMGYRKALVENNINFDAKLLKEGNLKTEDGYRATKKAILSKLDFTAVFAFSDLVAFGVIKALKEQGYKVPDRIAVVGYDNINFGFSAEQPLTTVHIPKYRLGSEGMRLLYRRIDKKVNKPQKVILDTKLIIRKSA